LSLALANTEQNTLDTNDVGDEKGKSRYLELKLYVVSLPSPFPGEFNSTSCSLSVYLQNDSLHSTDMGSNLSSHSTSSLTTPQSSVPASHHTKTLHTMDHATNTGIGQAMQLVSLSSSKELIATSLTTSKDQKTERMFMPGPP
jgi:hypothetical protein